MAAKLVTIFAEHPVIFLGYSLTDPNVTNILRSIASCLTTDNIDQLRDRLIFVQWDAEADCSVESANIVTDHFNIPVLAVQTDSFAPIFEALGELHRRFPARLLRQLKEHVYHLVLTNDPSQRLHVQDIDAESDISELDVVFGVGSLPAIGDLGYRSIKRQHLLEEVMDDRHGLEAETVVQVALPQILKTVEYVPVFKFLREAGYYDGNRNLREGDVPERVAEAAGRDLNFFTTPDYWKRKRAEVLGRADTFEGIVDAYDPDDVGYCVPLLDEDQIDVDALLEFIREHIELLETGNTVDRTQFIKLICIYDFLFYGPTE